jgi:N-acylglucosamine 2-epimerase
LDQKRIRELIETYRDGLFQDTLPFWTENAVDDEYGGFVTCLDRDGTVIDTDKAVWQQAHFIWLLSTLHATVEKRPGWVELSRRGIEFLRAHAFDRDGRMFFLLARDGRPLRKRRYAFSEAHGAAAFAAYALATGEARAADEARTLFQQFLRLTGTPGLLEPKLDPRTRPAKSLAVPMTRIATAQILKSTIGEPEADGVIDGAIEEIERHFLKPELECLLEHVGPKGEVIDHFDGRLIHVGRAFGTAWYLLAEAARREQDPALVQLATTILDWTWASAWDEEFGGLYALRDAKGLSPADPAHDMKLWWVHTEALVAALMAWRLTGEERYAQWHRHVHDWAYRHFPDPEHGEWYGYLHRDGSLATPIKGDVWKGPYHLPRMQLVAWMLLVEALEA